MAAPPGYTPEFPSTLSPTDKLRDFIPSFFQLSDDASRNEEWVGYFCSDATVVMGEDEAQGTERIRQLRSRMWDKVASRKHTVHHFSEAASRDPDEKGERDFVLEGEVEYRLKTGEIKAVPWTAHAKIKEDGNRIRFVRYKVEIHA
ncbi:uncharacterized protein PG986_001928 [Apiospora aurea]|uniref:Fungal specific transcription factor n=1 Tax=Apiospora aurea TaxID=335848 RepID=A0ABR1QZ93_9PEZI